MDGIIGCEIAGQFLGLGGQFQATSRVGVQHVNFVGQVAEERAQRRYLARAGNRGQTVVGRRAVGLSRALLADVGQKIVNIGQADGFQQRLIHVEDGNFFKRGITRYKPTADFDEAQKETQIEKIFKGSLG